MQLLYAVSQFLIVIKANPCPPKQHQQPNMTLISETCNFCYETNKRKHAIIF